MQVPCAILGEASAAFTIEHTMSMNAPSAGRCGGSLSFPHMFMFLCSSFNAAKSRSTQSVLPQPDQTRHYLRRFLSPDASFYQRQLVYLFKSLSSMSACHCLLCYEVQIFPDRLLKRYQHKGVAVHLNRAVHETGMYLLTSSRLDLSTRMSRFGWSIRL